MENANIKLAKSTLAVDLLASRTSLMSFRAFECKSYSNSPSRALICRRDSRASRFSGYNKLGDKKFSYETTLLRATRTRLFPSRFLSVD